MAPDLTVTNHGSLFVLAAETPEGQQWMDEHVGDDESLTWGGGIVVEPRYIHDIVEGAIDAGLEVR